MIYAYLDKNIKAANTEELTLNQNCSYEKLPVENIPEDASCIVAHGVLRGMDKVIKLAVEKNITWVVKFLNKMMMC